MGRTGVDAASFQTMPRCLTARTRPTSQLFTNKLGKTLGYLLPNPQLDPAGLPLPTHSGTMIRPRALSRPLCMVAAMLTGTVSEVHEPAGGGGGGGRADTGG